MTGVYAQDSVFRVNSFGVTLRKTDRSIVALCGGSPRGGRSVRYGGCAARPAAGRGREHRRAARLVTTNNLGGNFIVIVYFSSLICFQMNLQNA